MDVILFETSSASAADDIVSAVDAKSLWGVDMGTTSQSSSKSAYVIVKATATRVSNLIAAIPDNVSMQIHFHNFDTFTKASSEAQLWYLLGKLEG